MDPWRKRRSPGKIQRFLGLRPALRVLVSVDALVSWPGLVSGSAFGLLQAVGLLALGHAGR